VNRSPVNGNRPFGKDTASDGITGGHKGAKKYTKEERCQWEVEKTNVTVTIHTNECGTKRGGVIRPQGNLILRNLFPDFRIAVSRGGWNTRLTGQRQKRARGGERKGQKREGGRKKGKNLFPHDLCKRCSVSCKGGKPNRIRIINPKGRLSHTLRLQNRGRKGQRSKTTKKSW